MIMKEPRSLLIWIVVISTVASGLAIVQLLTGLLLFVIVGVQLLHMVGTLVPAIAVLVLGMMGLSAHRAVFLAAGNSTSWCHRCGEYFVMSMLTMCVVGNIVCALFLIAGVAMDLNVKNKLVERIMVAMHEYSQNLNIRKAVDQMQISLQCCGSYGYRDYFQFDWASTGTDDSREFTNWENAPFSCCNINILKPCMQNDLKYEGQDTLYQKGCATPLAESLTFNAYKVGILLNFTGIVQVTQRLLDRQHLIPQSLLVWRVYQAMTTNAFRYGHYSDEKADPEYTRSTTSTNEPLTSQTSSYSGDKDLESSTRAHFPKKQGGAGWPHGGAVDGGKDELPWDGCWNPTTKTCEECDMAACMTPTCHEQHVVAEKNTK